MVKRKRERVALLDKGQRFTKVQLAEIEASPFLFQQNNTGEYDSLFGN
jgi:hypothetical protein